MFSRLRDGLVPLIHAIAKKPPLAPLDRDFALEKQWALSKAIAAKLAGIGRSA